MIDDALILLVHSVEENKFVSLPASLSSPPSPAVTAASTLTPSPKPYREVFPSKQQPSTPVNSPATPKQTTSPPSSVSSSTNTLSSSAHHQQQTRQQISTLAVSGPSSSNPSTLDKVQSTLQGGLQGSQSEDFSDTLSKLISSNLLGDETAMQPEEQGSVLIMNAFDKTVSLSTYNLTDDLQWVSYANYRLEPVQVVEARARAGFSGGFCEAFHVHIFSEQGQQLSSGLGVKVTSGNTYEYRGGKGLFCITANKPNPNNANANNTNNDGSDVSSSTRRLSLEGSGRRLSMDSGGRRLSMDSDGDADEVEVVKKKRRSRGLKSGEFSMRAFDEM